MTFPSTLDDIYNDGPLKLFYLVTLWLFYLWKCIVYSSYKRNCLMYISQNISSSVSNADYCKHFASLSTLEAANQVKPFFLRYWGLNLGSVKLSPTPPHSFLFYFILRQNLIILSKLTLNLGSSCLNLQNCWDYKPAPLHLARAAFWSRLKAESCLIPCATPPLNISRPLCSDPGGGCKTWGWYHCCGVRSSVCSWASVSQVKDSLTQL